MYTRNITEPKIAPSNFELENCMEGADVFDSALLYNLSLNKEVHREDYVVKENWYRPDLIATEFYGDVRYEAFVILQAGSIQNITPGTVLKLISKEDIKTLKDGSTSRK
jgi:hypothetical protein